MIESSRNTVFLFVFLFNLINFDNKFIAAQRAIFTCNKSVCFYYFCNNDVGNYTANSPYQQNLNTLLSSLPNTTSTKYGFSNSSAGQGPDRVNSIALCRGDIDQPECWSCISDSIAMIKWFCPTQMEALIWYDNCMVRYSNWSVSGAIANRPEMNLYNPDDATDAAQFLEKLNNLMDKLKEEAAGGGPLRKFATGNITGPASYIIYGLMQCTPDLTQSQCNDCLSSAMMQIPLLANGKLKRGGRIRWTICNLRYETFYFFTNPPAIALQPPSPPPSSLHQETPIRQGKNSKTTQTVVVVVVPIIGCALLLGSIWIFIKRRGKQMEENDKFERKISTPYLTIYTSPRICCS